MLDLTSLTALVGFARAGLSVAHAYGTAAPALASGAQTVVTAGKTVLADLGKVEADLKAGKYADVPADLERAAADVTAAIGAVAKEGEQIAALATSTPSLPSVTGISAILAKI